LKEAGENNSSQLQILVKGMLFKEFFLKIRSKETTYNNESKMRYNVMTVNDLDYLKESGKLLRLINKSLK
jgi:hypothetical protein